MIEAEPDTAGADVHTAMFEPAGPDAWTPTELARGPWDPRHCHGGPVGALLALGVERADDDRQQTDPQQTDP